MTHRILSLYYEGGIGRVITGINDFMRYRLLRGINGFRPGKSIWEKEWDILCVLDGCRYDTFNEVYPGEATSTISVASTSESWIRKELKKHDTSDVGYISGNPYAADLKKEEFHSLHLEGVIKTDYGVETVPPEPLTQRAVELFQRKDSPNRLIIHYMQPHVPFRSRPEWFEEFLETDEWGATGWDRLNTGTVSEEDWLAAYRDNLQWVLGEGGIESIKTSVDARIALTSDHGNAIGEYGIYGHPRRIPIDAVRKVPWAEIEGKKDSDNTTDMNYQSQAFEVEDQLEALGYK